MGAPGQTDSNGVAWPKNGVHYIEALVTPLGDFASEKSRGNAQGGMFDMQKWTLASEESRNRRSGVRVWRI